MALTIDFTGKVALITGGTKGVGLGIARRFADAGASVVVCARSIPEGLPSEWDAVAVDLQEPAVAKGFIDSVVERHGSLDFLVNNAGGAPAADTSTASPNFSRKIVGLNFFSAMWCSEAANHHMQTQPEGGAIVNIGSVSAERPSPTAAAYAAAKAALANYTRTTGQEWLPKVRVNSVTVGMVRTELVHQWYGDDENIRRTEARIPIGRLALPTDVGDACVFLSSPLASYVSGASLLVHGGGDWPAFLETPFHGSAKK